MFTDIQTDVKLLILPHLRIMKPYRGYLYHNAYVPKMVEHPQVFKKVDHKNLVIFFFFTDPNHSHVYFTKKPL